MTSIIAQDRAASALPQVAILLCTYNGEKHLAPQLASLEAQTLADWVLWVGDDGSRDGTREVLGRFAARWGDGRLTLREGPRAGFVANFMTLTCEPSLQAAYYAFCDQDDVWMPGKLERALAWLRGVDPSVPALYCSRTLLVDADDREIGLSPLFGRPPLFANALVQNVGSGNTMVFNDAARRLLVAAGAAVQVFAHDWWAYLLVSGCGGQVHYDPEPSLRYRQHGGNQIGLSRGPAATVRRLRAMLQGRYRHWNDMHVQALLDVRELLSPGGRRTFDAFEHARRQWLVPRMAGFWRCGIYRQTLLGNAGLVAAAALNRV